MAPDPLKYARIEHERRFLLRTIPAGMSAKARTIEDLYVDGTRLRVRKVSSNGDIERKLGQKLTLDDGRRIITSIYLSSAEHARLDALPGARIAKMRHRCVERGLDYAIDVFGGSLAGVVIAEIEAQSDEALRALPTPTFAHCEITDRPELTGYALAVAPAAALAFARRLLAEPAANAL